MSGGVLEKTVCEKCGVDVRENTYFCYNCGTKIGDSKLPARTAGADDPENVEVASERAEKPDDLNGVPISRKINIKGREALEDLAERIKLDDKPDAGEAIARAAAKRKKSRSAKRKGIEYVWEPVDEPPGRLMMILVGIIVLLSALVVVMTVIWK